MRINNNLMALNTHRQLKINTAKQENSIQKLSSGLRITKAGDDAAGLAISEKMRGQIRGLETASKNSRDAISLIQTAEGALQETHSILQRMRELAVQASNDTNVTADRTAIDTELDALVSEVDRIASKTQYNTQNLINGSFTGKVVQVGANAAETMTITIASMDATALSVDALDVTSSLTAQAAISSINIAIETVSTARSGLGASQNRLEHSIANLDASAENLQAAESRIRDVDMAKEMMTYTKSNILNQAATAMLAQANQAPQGVLQLLQ